MIFSKLVAKRNRLAEIRTKLSGIFRKPRYTEKKIFLVEDDRYVICMNLFSKGGGFDWSMGCKLSGYSLAYRGYWRSEGRRVRSNAHIAVPDDGTNFEDTHCKRKVLQARRSVLAGLYR